MKYRKIYFAISALVIGVGIFSLVRWGLPLGVDFVGGTIAEYQLSKDVSTSELADKLKEKDLPVLSVTKSQVGVYLLKFPPIFTNQLIKIINYRLFFYFTFLQTASISRYIIC